MVLNKRQSLFSTGEGDVFNGTCKEYWYWVNIPRDFAAWDTELKFDDQLEILQWCKDKFGPYQGENDTEQRRWRYSVGTFTFHFRHDRDRTAFILRWV